MGWMGAILVVIGVLMGIAGFLGGALFGLFIFGGAFAVFAVGLILIGLDEVAKAVKAAGEKQVDTLRKGFETLYKQAEFTRTSGPIPVLNARPAPLPPGEG